MPCYNSVSTPLQTAAPRAFSGPYGRGAVLFSGQGAMGVESWGREITRSRDHARVYGPHYNYEDDGK
jgi:hypothetical protein